MIRIPVKFGVLQWGSAITGRLVDVLFKSLVLTMATTDRIHDFNWLSDVQREALEERLLAIPSTLSPHVFSRNLWITIWLSSGDVKVSSISEVATSARFTVFCAIELCPHKMNM